MNETNGSVNHSTANDINNGNTNNNTNNEIANVTRENSVNVKKSHPFLKGFVVFLIIGVLLFGAVKCVEYAMTENPLTSQGNSDGAHKLLSRSARNSDLQVDSKLDFSSLGVKYVIIPQTDIKGLEITISFLDSNKKVLTSIEKALGNVKEGVQISFSISLLDLSFSVALNTKYESWTVTGGTVSYFA